MTIDPHRNQPLFRFGRVLEEADAVMILLHGRGGFAQEMFSLGDALGGSGFAYLAPQAADYTWYPASFLAPLEENEPYLSSALKKVESIVQLAIAAAMSPETIVIVGFSQGACLATEFVARHPRKYAGLVALSGGLIGPPGADLSHPGSLARTPAFFGSADPDQHVPWRRVQHSAEILREMGADVELQRYPGMPHSIFQGEVESAREHLLNLSPLLRMSN